MRWKISYDPHAVGTDRGDPRDAGEAYACQRVPVLLSYRIMNDEINHQSLWLVVFLYPFLGGAHMRKLLFFHAPWCPPCRFYEKEFILPLIQVAGADKVQKINAQEDPFTANKYSIDKLPAVVLLDGEQVKMNRTGAIDIKKIAEFLEGSDVF